MRVYTVNIYYALFCFDLPSLLCCAQIMLGNVKEISGSLSILGSDCITTLNVFRSLRVVQGLVEISENR